MCECCGYWTYTYSITKHFSLVLITSCVGAAGLVRALCSFYQGWVSLKLSCSDLAWLCLDQIFQVPCLLFLRFATNKVKLSQNELTLSNNDDGPLHFVYPCTKPFCSVKLRKLSKNDRDGPLHFFLQLFSNPLWNLEIMFTIQIQCFTKYLVTVEIVV